MNAKKEGRDNMERVASSPLVDFLGLELPLIGCEEAIEQISRNIGRQATVLYFINAHTVSLSLKDSGYHAVLQKADVILNDGVALDVAARIMGFRFPEDLPGNIVIPALFKREELPRPLRVFLLGGESHIVEQAARKFSACFPDIRISGFHHGFFQQDEEAEVLQKINACKPHVLLVGMGNPKQELFIHRNREHLEPCLMAGVGGLIDIWGGRIRDYPRWATSLRLHWFCRLCQEPRRLAFRYLVEMPAFLIKVSVSHRKSFNLLTPSLSRKEKKPSVRMNE